MNALLNIPSHTKCNNCGDCCGMIPASQGEIAEIRKYLNQNEKAKKAAQKNSGKALNCPFRDNKAKRCIIYQVRPTICKLMGVCKGMECPQGNTVEIDGTVFLKSHNVNTTEILNFVKW